MPKNEASYKNFNKLTSLIKPEASTRKVKAISLGATNKESGELNMKFIEANEFATKIEKALQEGEIYIDDDTRTLKYFNGSSEIIL
jgi:hypothetical protein